MQDWSQQDATRDIARRLDAIEARENVRILFAVESGSRAWGFPSPDSDYDVRFVYLGAVERYVTLQAVRDVIEEPIELPFDVNGWDLKKALGLALASNPVLLEWLTSPIVYHEAPALRAEFTAIALAGLRRRALMHHYLGLGWNNYERHVQGRERIKLKKLFYVLRPVFALQWLLDNAERRTPPPMHFPTLMNEIDLTPPIRSLVERLLALKASTREMGEGPVEPSLETLATAVLERARAAVTNMPDDAASGEAVLHADAFLRRLVLDGAPS